LSFEEWDWFISEAPPASLLPFLYFIFKGRTATNCLSHQVSLAAGSLPGFFGVQRICLNFGCFFANQAMHLTKPPIVS